MADCFSLPNVAELVNFLRGEAKELSMLANGKTECNALWKAADVIEQLLTENAKLKEAFDRCYESNENLYNELQEVKADRDAAVAAVEELNDDFVDCVCSNYGNLSPYCGNRCVDCVDERGWCKEVTKYCHGFIPMAYKDWRGVQKEENDVSKT